jgi:hypothetical protein
MYQQSPQLTAHSAMPDSLERAEINLQHLIHHLLLRLERNAFKETTETRELALRKTFRPFSNIHAKQKMG